MPVPARSLLSSSRCLCESFLPSIITYATVKRLLIRLSYCFSISSVPANGHRASAGITSSLSSGNGEWRLRVMLHSVSSSSRLTEGVTPTVDTVTRLRPAARPHSAVRMRQARITSSMLSPGSPMPIITIWVISWGMLITWLTISPAVRFPFHPLFPVAQKRHPIRQPDCTETHTVRRLSSGRNTVSWAMPFLLVNRYLTEPSEETSEAVGELRPGTAYSDKMRRNFCGMSLISSNDLMPRR